MIPITHPDVVPLFQLRNTSVRLLCVHVLGGKSSGDIVVYAAVRNDAVLHELQCKLLPICNVRDYFPKMFVATDTKCVEENDKKTVQSAVARTKSS